MASSDIQHLYVHVPFCHRICPYCAFYKHLPGSLSPRQFVDAVLAEARRWRERLPLALRTVYLGGGTPTFLSDGLLETLLVGLREVFGFAELEEFGLEANPRTVTPSKAAVLARCGITRASIGVQAWDSATLATLGRDHQPEEAVETFETLRGAGIPSLNLDLMFSIPGQSPELWLATLERTLSLRPDHVSAYNLNYEEDTAYFDRLAKGLYRENPEQDAAMFYAAVEALSRAGFEHYEISNYAQPGHHSQHNIGYWMGEDYLGLGPSAVSTHAGRRWQNIADTARYLAAAESGLAPLQSEEFLTPEAMTIERIALELRTSAGVALSHILVDHSQVSDLVGDGLVEIIGQRLRLTHQGKALADPIASALIGG